MSHIPAVLSFSIKNTNETFFKSQIKHICPNVELHNDLLFENYGEPHALPQQNKNICTLQLNLVRVWENNVRKVSNPKQSYS